MKLYRLLMVDDEKEYCETLRDKVSKTGDDLGLSILVDDVQNWDDACPKLRAGDYHAVILDAKCFVSRDQDVEDFGFLPVALSGIEKIEQERDRRIPVVVNTGYIGAVELSTIERLLKSRSIRTFSKTGDGGNELIKHIVNEIDAAPERWIELKHADVFQVFDLGLLKAEYRDSLRKILLTGSENSQIATNLGALRNIQQEIYNVLESRRVFDSKSIPRRNRAPKFWERNEFLAGLPLWDHSMSQHIPQSTVFQTDTITKIADSIFSIASNWGSHSPRAMPKNVEVKYWNKPSIYVVKSLTYGLLEQLLWLKELTK